jgi:hypothetical protein
MKGQVTIGAIFATVVLFIVLVSIAPIFYTGIVGGWASLSIAEKGLGVLLWEIGGGSDVVCFGCTFALFDPDVFTADIRTVSIWCRKPLDSRKL